MLTGKNSSGFSLITTPTEPKASLNGGLKEPKVEPKEWPKMDRDVRCPNCSETVRPLVITSEERGTRYHCPNCKRIIPESKIGQPKEEKDKGVKESIVKRERKPKEILSDILDRHPDLASKQAAYIMDAVKEIEVPHPYEIWWYLNNLRGVDRKTAEMVMYQYQSAIQPLSREPSVPPPIVGHQQQVSTSPWIAPWQMPPYNPYNPMTPQMSMQQQPVQSVPMPYNPQPQPQANVSSQGSEKSLSKDEVIRIVEEREREKKERLTREDLIKIIGERGEKPKGELSEERLLQLIDERNEKKREGEKESALMGTLNLIRQEMNNFNVRMSAVEQAGSIAKPVEKAKNPIQEQVDAAVGKRITSMILGEGAVTLDQVRAATSDEIRKHVPPPPTGKRNQYDMEVEKATHNADARKIEAEERRKGFEAVGGGIRDGFASLGWNIGAGAASGSPRSGPSLEAQTEVRMPAAEPQPMVWRDGVWYTRCAYSDCRAPMAFEDGKSTVTCPTCHRVIQVQPTEDELKRKFENGKIEPITAEPPKAKTEVKLEKPKREEPEHEEPREKPQQKEERPSEAEKPESVEEKPSAEAKPEEKSKGELDVKATEKAEGVAA